MFSKAAVRHILRPPIPRGLCTQRQSAASSSKAWQLLLLLAAHSCPQSWRRLGKSRSAPGGGGVGGGNQRRPQYVPQPQWGVKKKLLTERKGRWRTAKIGPQRSGGGLPSAQPPLLSADILHLLAVHPSFSTTEPRMCNPSEECNGKLMTSAFSMTSVQGGLHTLGP